MSTGMNRDDARREAEREFGDLAYTRRYCETQDRVADREVRRAEWFAELVDDLKWTMRGIRRRPSFAAIVAITLALGVGANAAVFSVLNTVLLHGAPYREPDRLVAIDENNVPGGARYSDVCRGRVSRLDDGVAFVRGDRDGGTAIVHICRRAGARSNSRSSRIGQFLRRAGRGPRARSNVPGGEDRGVNRVVVLTDGVWRRLFGADPSIVGRQIPFSGDAYTIIGVLKPDFVFPGAVPQLFAPIDFTAAMSDVNRARKFHFTHAIGRLRRGVTPSRGPRGAASDRASRRAGESRREHRSSGLGTRCFATQWSAEFGRHCWRSPARRRSCCSSRARTSRTSRSPARRLGGARSLFARRWARAAAGWFARRSPRASSSVCLAVSRGRLPDCLPRRR